MKWEWVVPVIVFVVYLLNHILRNRAMDEPVRPRPGNPKPNRGSTSDIDRFLQEIDRLRQKGNTPERVEPVERPVVKPVPKVRPANQQAQRARSVTRVRDERRADAIPVVTAVQPVDVLPVATVAAESPSSKRGLQVDRRPDRRSTPVATALNLLRTPQTLAAAILLQEVLGPPKCKRR